MTVDEIASAMRAVGLSAYVERLGANVYGVTDGSGSRTVTVNGGQRETDDGPAEALVCEDGAEIWRAMVTRAAEVPVLIVAVLPAWN